MNSKALSKSAAHSQSFSAYFLNPRARLDALNVRQRMRQVILCATKVAKCSPEQRKGIVRRAEVPYVGRCVQTCIRNQPIVDVAHVVLAPNRDRRVRELVQHRNVVAVSIDYIWSGLEQSAKLQSRIINTAEGMVDVDHDDSPWHERGYELDAGRKR